MKINNIVGGSLVALSLLLAAAPLASAQVIAQPAPNSCVSFQSNLSSGATDSATGGAVTALQNFLVSQGFFSSAYLGTGRFGPLTAHAVAQYQAAHGISAIGSVGPLTRASIYSVSCGSATIILPPSSGPVSLYSIYPTIGPVGTTVAINGFGFTSANTVLLDGMLAAQNVPITSSIAIACTTNPSCHGGINQTLVFTIPQYLTPNCAPNMMCAQLARLTTPGQYNLTVINSNGTSNTLVFTVSSSSTNVQPLSLSGIDAPATLTIGQQGTWTVHAITNTAAGNLHYSVVWGDEAQLGSSIMAPQTTTVQSSASFSHTYSHSGTYTVQFTVSDDAGHSVTASNTIVVQPVY